MFGTNPFTPKSGEEPRVFIGRGEELAAFSKRFDMLLSGGRQEHFVVLGEWGVGKTSLLKEFKRIAQRKGALCSLVQLRKVKGGESLREITEYLIEQIALRLPLELGALKRFAKELASAGVTVAGTGFQFSKEVRRGDPQTFLYSSLLNLWQDVRRKAKAVVVLLDDVQNVSEEADYFVTLLKTVLSDERIVKETRFLFVLTSTPGAWQQFLQRDHPIGRYFVPRLKLGNLSKEETLEMIDAMLNGSRVQFGKDVKEKIFSMAAGHPYEAHVLCGHLFDNQINGNVTMKQFESGLSQTLQVLGEEVFNALYEKASITERQALAALACFNSPTSYTRIATLGKRKFKIAENILSISLNRLTEKGVVEKPERGKYLISDPLFRTYVIRAAK